MSQGRPTGVTPPHVYRRRRLVVLGLPLLLVALVVWLVGRGSAGEPAAAATPTVAATGKAPASERRAAPTKEKPTKQKPTRPTPTATTPTVAPNVPGCDSVDLDLSADAKSYSAGENPRLTMTVTNTGSAACLVDDGTAHAVLVITSGDDDVWSNQHCAAAGSRSHPLLLSAGKSATTDVTWKRVRSSEACAASPAAAKTGTYAVTYSLDGENAAPVVLRLR
ncbi:DUF4232 domain-containing protein [Cellulomonas edaphi]|uniref:DUF4232 domain-containing protein n=1 Tax=Cellulomonas edaphi TaxID=3053468 RepID=A0ABT7S409_9CELL|nr:DUF4232 domain-containing protein [Cellulomons edaphi]MDM7830356.1 DUF4232 domain-containing protein [Cellulomons edaphi]